MSRNTRKNFDVSQGIYSEENIDCFISENWI